MRWPGRPQRPPVPAPGHLHERRPEHGTDHQGIDQHRDGEAKPDHLHDEHAREGEGAEDDDHDQGGAGDDRAGVGQRVADAALRIAGFEIDGAHPGEQENLVIHAQAEQDAEDDERHGDRHDPGAAGQAEQFRAVAELEHQDDHAIAGGDGQQVQHQRLGCRQWRPEKEQQRDRGKAQHQGDRQRIGGAGRGVEILQILRLPADLGDEPVGLQCGGDRAGERSRNWAGEELSVGITRNSKRVRSSLVKASR